MGAEHLVTGGAGFIGSNLVRRLAGEGVRVRVFDNLSSGRRENLEGLDAAVEFAEGEIGRASCRERVSVVV